MKNTPIICAFVLLVCGLTFTNNIYAGGVPAPAAPDLLVSSDTGISGGDNLTNSLAPAFSISGLTPGATVVLLRNGTPAASGVTAGNTLTLTDTAPILSDGPVGYSARQTVGPNTSAPGPTLTVTFDRTRPAVTVNQDSGQADPTAALPIRYAVVFSEPVQCSPFVIFPPDQCFDFGEFSFAGSTAYVLAGAHQVIGEGESYSIAIGAVRSPGTVVLSFNDARVKDAAGNYNTASTSTDNGVTFQPQRFYGSLKGRVRTAGGGLPHPGMVMRLTDTTTGEVRTATLNPAGYYKFKNIPLWVGVESPFVIEARRKTQLIVEDTFVLEGDDTHNDFVIQY